MSTIEERFELLENRVTELERFRRSQEERDLALLYRVDNFIDDLRRIERVQMRSFDEIMQHQKEQDARLDSLETSVAILVDAAKDHKRAIEALALGQQELAQGQQALAQGQQQILMLLTGKAPRND
jgi:Mg2+ and Co2+ transporter CorA